MRHFPSLVAYASPGEANLERLSEKVQSRRGDESIRRTPLGLGHGMATRLNEKTDRTPRERGKGFRIVTGPLARRIFFDLDGVLVDSSVGIVACVNETLLSFGYAPLSATRIESIIGPPLQAGFASLLSEIGGDERLVPACVAGYRERYERVATHGGTVLQPGIAEMLATVRDDATLAIATSKPLRFAEPIVSALGIRDSFAVICGPTPDVEGESKIATLARAIAQVDALLGADVFQTFMIGDRHHDIEAAIACGVTPIGVTWGFGSENELRTAGAIAIAHDCVSLTALLVPNPSRA